MTEDKRVGIRKVFKASFEQSLNLADEDLLDVHKTWEYKQTLRKEKKRKPAGKVKILVLRVLMLFPIWLCSVLANYMCSNLDQYVAPVNLFPEWLCWVLIVVFLIVVYGYKYGLKQNWEQMRFYNSQWMQFCYLLLFCVVLNLVVVMAFTSMAPTHIIIAIFVATVVFGVLIFRSRMKGIVTILYDQGSEETTINVVMKKILVTFIKLVGMITVPYMLFMIKNPEVEESLKKNTFFAIGGFIVSNVLMIIALIYMTFTFVIQGYYRNKYAEEYRKREGQTQIQWYGEKYFNKHIKGTEKEERNDDRDKERF